MNSESSSEATQPGRLEREQVAQLESWIRGYPIHPDDDANIAWVRETWNVLNPHSTGARYLNFEAEDGVQATYGAEKYERLAAVKAKYDPENFFRFNQNIKPTVSGGRPL
jgi:FAD/FMN-containing dehydrogenase